MVTVISVSIPEEYVKRIDEIVEQEGFSSRSEAVRHALELLLAREEQEGGLGFKLVVVVSDHNESPYVDRNIIGIIHGYAEDLKGLYHQIVDGGTCVTVAITGDHGEEWKIMARKLRKLRGVKAVRIISL
ncbi:MAG: CopG family ribbon-helix-helix protein [Desulfurococcales archaeon]|nr:CopG family ribbon-helix-helix protein [Desulfurococcales archaeon]